MKMIEDILARALIKYRIYINIGNNFSLHEIDIISSQIDICENYLSQGNKVTGTWLADNRELLSEVVKHAHDIVHDEDTEYDRKSSLKEEHKILNKCMTFFKELK